MKRIKEFFSSLDINDLLENKKFLISMLSIGVAMMLSGIIYILVK